MVLSLASEPGSEAGSAFRGHGEGCLPRPAPCPPGLMATGHMLWFVACRFGWVLFQEFMTLVHPEGGEQCLGLVAHAAGAGGKSLSPALSWESEGCGPVRGSEP